MSFNILKRLGFDDQYINKICFYIKNHDNPINERLINDDYEKTLNLYKINKPILLLTILINRKTAKNI